jgi:hypothetical protein
MSRLIRRLAPLFALVLALVAFLPLATPVGAADAMVRVVHASPDAPAVDVYVDGQRAVSNLGYTQGTNYTMLPEGQHQIQVFAAGTGPGGTAVIAAPVTVQGGRAYTIVAANVLAKIEPLVIPDDLTPPAAGKAHIRVIHASPDAPAVDVAVQGGPVPFKNAAFKAATPYTPVDAGTYTFEVRPTGTTTAVLTTSPTALAAGRLYTVFAMGQVGNNTLKAIAFTDNAAVGGMPATGGGAMAATENGQLPLIGLGLLALGVTVAGGMALRLRAARLR